MGYAFNLCKFHIYTIPYTHNIPKEGMEMTQNRIRIVDVADALGLSTATVSKVIHGKTEKISDQTVKRVQQELERSGYIPNIAGRESNPSLTTIHQEAGLRAKAAMECLEAMRDGAVLM